MEHKYSNFIQAIKLRPKPNPKSQINMPTLSSQMLCPYLKKGHIHEFNQRGDIKCQIADVC